MSTMTLEQINDGIAWLDAKFRRHGEEEDKQCADMLRDYATLLRKRESSGARVPDGYTALLSDGKRYWSDKPGQHGEWFPYYLGNAATKPEKE